MSADPNSTSSPDRGAGSLRVAVVVSRYNATITRPLLEGARQAWAERGGDPADLTVIGVPGAYELTAGAAIVARTERIDGVCALGCIIKGDTDHDVHIAQAVANGLNDVTLQTGVPCAFGVLTTNTPEQARDRVGGAKGNKGFEAMQALIDMARLHRHALSNNDWPWNLRSDPFAPSAPDKAAAEDGA
ncbi:MAG: 6,7-dimethyl-8-ribityllumazine synthase [Planctomycetota bacterium]